MVAALALACSDSPPPSGPAPVEIQPYSATSISWNLTARELITARTVTNATLQARTLAYLSIAQYNAIVAADGAKKGSEQPSLAAATAGASVTVLRSLFPLDTALLDAKLLAQKTAGSWPGEKPSNFAAGEAIGRAIGLQVVAYSATDKLNVGDLPVNPGGAGAWTGTNSLRGAYGARTFVLTSGSQFRPGPPPAFGSPEFDAALAETRAFSDSLTPAQLVIAQTWGPQGPAYMNRVAAEILLAKQTSERDAARILALANMAGFDASAGCFEAKFAYYLIRPSQADPKIKTPIGLPNHPSYPSAHSCFTASYGTVIAATYPDTKERLQGMVTEAGLSRLYAGIHYRFDLEAGKEIGRKVAEYAIQTAPAAGSAIPLD